MSNKYGIQVIIAQHGDLLTYGVTRSYNEGVQVNTITPIASPWNNKVAMDAHNGSFYTDCNQIRFIGWTLEEIDSFLCKDIPFLTNDHRQQWSRRKLASYELIHREMAAEWLGKNV